MSEHAVWIGTDSDGGYHWHTAHEDRDECLARIRSIVIEEGDVLLVPTFVRVFAQAEGSLAGGEQVRSSEAASQSTTPAAVDTAKGGEDERPADLHGTIKLAEMMVEGYRGDRDTLQYRFAKALVFQSHRTAAGWEGVADGWKLVPLKPTVEMLHACRAALQTYIDALPEERRISGGKLGLQIHRDVKARVRYQAMISAAPALAKEKS